ncbi:EamA family transporter [Sphingobacterium anhuiense]|uniref:EamA family transporter n=1 Tax=Sphingobacterium anhuiense TaxID=493780 RepID=A0ABW5YZ91_9SPHI
MTNVQQDTEGRGKYFLAAFLGPLIWGFMAVPIRLLKNWSAEDILHYRIILAVSLLWLFNILFRKADLKADYNHFWQLSREKRIKIICLTVISAIFLFANWYTYIYCINSISVQAGAFAYILCPLITTAAGYLILKENLNIAQKLSLFVASTGVLMLATGSLTEVLWSLTIGALYAFYLVLQRIIQGFDKLNMLAIQLAICTLFIIPQMLIDQSPIPQDSTFWTVTLTIALLFTIIPLFSSMYALKKISSSTLGIMLYINPIIAFALAITYFREQVDPYKFWAYGLIFIAILIFNSDKIKFLFKRKKYM